MKRKMKLAFIENGKSRKTTFTKRKKGMMKKLEELVTLCGVKACAVVYSPYNLIPEAWPSREGVEEVVSKFMELSMMDRTKKMVDQETFTRQRIAKAKEQLQKLRDENRNSHIRDLMFGCLKGETDVYHLDGNDLQDLSLLIDKYLNGLTHRIEIFTENGESSSSLPLPIVADAAAQIGFDGRMIQYQNQNHQKPVQFQYQALFDFYDQLPKKIHDFNMDMNMDSNQSMILDLNQNLSDGEDEGIPCMDSNNYQPEIDCLATITTATTDVCAPNITNNL
ncbi:MADS-box transcription factor PHERES 2 [Arabidopsis lyrata subsp. lyrata]|uniref:MADS-box transcription factor PHERES 2 n=1 Tax=Arabidopsis lyrata subsp. lyrata TaxID=81972 RepID=UPI000A29BFB0|nr:MADS-box transcription factor PHERES 2 [Arabidopsis lyrata subsp. lyrata]|eukprot:XP_020890945.1 MADS-box transcription factor PHERES 2 [Arabidopsis lyrata subsp. lyrata]